VNIRLGAVVEDEVVTLAVSPGLADAEAALGRLVEESGFGALSGALGWRGCGCCWGCDGVGTSGSGKFIAYSYVSYDRGFRL